MLLKSHELNAHLKTDLAPIYLFHGAEPLLIEDSANLLRQTLKQKGFAERIIFTLETGFDWPRFTDEFTSMSLFAEQKLIELRLATGKPGPKGAEILSEIAVNPEADTVLLILTGKLDAGVKNTKWMKQLSQHGVVVEHYAVTANQLLDWILNRAKQYQLVINHDACRLLAYYLEGNLLAIDQELKKYTLLDSDKAITEKMVQHSVQDSARFSVYGLVDAAVAGNLKRALRMLASLRSEGTEPILINWALARETRSLLEMSNEIDQGKNIAAVLKQHRVWNNRVGIVKVALKRLNNTQCKRIHRRAAMLDRMIKGRESTTMKADIWTEYERILAWLCGVTTTC